MKITNRELIRQTSITDIVVRVEEIDYKFQVTVHEAPAHPVYVSDIEYLDRFIVPLKNSVKKQIRKFIKEKFENENN